MAVRIRKAAAAVHVGQKKLISEMLLIYILSRVKERASYKELILRKVISKLNSTLWPQSASGL
jgi:hypothetical protein